MELATLVCLGYFMTRAVYGSIETDSKHSSFVIGPFRKGLYTPGLPQTHRVTGREGWIL